ncbi:MAG: carbohydrate ABC transporter permease [Clostridia bacterium]|nr:carbohydrate ABC transporter permease [Clostridia bacterium]
MSRGDKAFQMAVNVICVLIGIVTLYPLIYVLSASFSNPIRILDGSVVIWPVEATSGAYSRVFASQNVQTGYLNTLYYAVVGTSINLLLTICAAYPLSRRDMRGRTFFTFMITFTMFFSGGMIPLFLTVKQVGLLNTRMSIILPTAINATNMLIMRNYFINSIPNELIEAAEIDGCSPLNTMLRVVLPLSKSILAVIMIYYMVAHWNAYFNALLYLTTKKEYYPLQVFLRQILLLSQMGDMAESTGVNDVNQMLLYVSLKYAIIVVSAVPLLILYPMMQKFFEKGIMMGAIKG